VKRLIFFFIFMIAAAGAQAQSEPIAYDSGSRRDPFVPLVGPGGVMVQKFNPTDLIVEGIVFDPGGTGSLVLINGEFYKEGDQVKNANIITIFKDRVVLQQADEEKTLWIREEVYTPGENPNAKK
jgi:type II secretory pathway component PulC